MINAPLAPEARFKRDVLLAEQTQRELTREEQAALADFIDTLEMANAGRYLLLGAGIDVDALMATPIDDIFADYMPEE